ncbi:MAG: efflux transporter, family, subunit, partial [Bryobacterales bacterium]|nr:efflux transporter, family, subunit [Bryobacterales bacterium]
FSNPATLKRAETSKHPNEANLTKLKMYLCASGALLASSLSLSCNTKAGAANQAMAMPPPTVSVVEVGPHDVPIYSEYAAQSFARDMVEVRGRVDGYIEKRLFQVGSDVQAGQVLYVLDLRPYQADVQKAKGDVAQSEANLEYARKQVGLLQAQADLAQAEANLAKAKQDVQRLQPLVKQEAAPQQDLDNAVAALQGNQANVDAKKANVEQNRLSTRSQIGTTEAQLESNKALLRNAELNLEYATVHAPIGGRIGDSLIPVGGLVSKTSTQPLTTIVPLDPIWVRFKVSEGEYLASQRQKNHAEVSRIPLELILADGNVHPWPGHIQNALNQVDAKTGTLELQATFPNPRHNVLPGQFGKIRVKTDERPNAITVPQRALQELQGMQSVFTVGSDNKVLAHSVVTGDRIGSDQIIEQGLKQGDRVIVEGALKVRPGMAVDPQPYKPASK